MSAMRILGALLGAGLGGTAAMTADAYIDKGITIPKKFPESFPLVGGKDIPIVGGIELEPGMGVAAAGLVGAMAGIPGSGSFTLGALGSEAPKMVGQKIPQVLYGKGAPGQLPAGQATSTAGVGVTVAGLAKPEESTKKRITDADITRRLDALISRGATAPTV